MSATIRSFYLCDLWAPLDLANLWLRCSDSFSGDRRRGSRAISRQSIYMAPTSIQRSNGAGSHAKAGHELGYSGVIFGRSLPPTPGRLFLASSMGVTVPVLFSLFSWSWCRVPSLWCILNFAVQCTVFESNQSFLFWPLRAGGLVFSDHRGQARPVRGVSADSQEAMFP